VRNWIGWKNVINEAINKANEARSIIDGAIFSGAKEAMKTYIEKLEESADPSNKDLCQRLIITRQLLKGFIREFESAMANGKVEQMKELERANKKERVAVFRR